MKKKKERTLYQQFCDVAGVDEFKADGGYINTAIACWEVNKERIPFYSMEDALDDATRSTFIPEVGNVEALVREFLWSVEDAEEIVKNGHNDFDCYIVDGGLLYW